MEPIPQSAAVLAALKAAGDQDLSDHVREVARLVRTVVPQCTGMSLSLLAERLTLTLIATDAQVAALDAVQYLQGGPCVDAIARDGLLRTDDLSARTVDQHPGHVIGTPCQVPDRPPPVGASGRSSVLHPPTRGLLRHDRPAQRRHPPLPHHR
jgi:hypothetical protein